MTKTISKLALASLLATFTLGVVAQLPAQEKKEESPAAPAAKEKQQHFPLRKGKIEAADKAAMTIKVGERTFKVTSTTKIMKGGQAATFDDAKVGEEVTGAYTKSEDGTLALLSLYIGPRPEKEAKPEKSDKTKE